MYCQCHCKSHYSTEDSHLKAGLHRKLFHLRLGLGPTECMPLSAETQKVLWSFWLYNTPKNSRQNNNNLQKRAYLVIWTFQERSTQTEPKAQHNLPPYLVTIISVELCLHTGNDWGKQRTASINIEKSVLNTEFTHYLT